MFQSLISRAVSRSTQVINQHVRFASTNTFKRPTHPFMEFFTNAKSNRTGRAWSVQELRTKSQEDLEKLWFVILKERNVLATYENYCRQCRVVMRNRDRIEKCRKSHANIKFVLNERRLELKTLKRDNRFLALQEKKREQRRLERAEKKFENRTYKTPNQHGNVNIQDKIWRRKTMGQTYLSKIQPRTASSSPVVPPSASV